MDSKEAVTPESLAVAAYVRSRIARLHDATDPSGGGTAIKVRIGSRYFLATANHVIPPSHDVRVIIPGANGDAIASFAKCLRAPEIDVASLELSPGDADSLGGTFAARDEFVTSVNHGLPFQVTVAGYPGALTATGHTTTKLGNRRRVHDFRTVTYRTNLVIIERWPIDAERPPNPHSDVFVDYDPSPESLRISPVDPSANPEKVRLENLPPGGLSGGGIWIEQVSNANSPVWQPSLRLAAIETSYYPRSKLLRGTLIGRWLELVAGHYPDLSNEIQAGG